jgi:hypothetical protein
VKRLDVIVWEWGDRVVTSGGPGTVVRAAMNPFAFKAAVAVALDADGEDWWFDAETLHPAPGQEPSSGPHRCQHVGPTLSMPGEPVQCGPCIYCGTPHEEWETLV